jgi:hypothetical protein
MKNIIIILFSAIIITGCKWGVEEPYVANVRFEMSSTDPNFSVAYYKLSGMATQKNNYFTGSLWTLDTTLSLPVNIEFSGYSDDEENNTIETRIYVNGNLRDSKSCTGIISGTNNAYLNITLK